jgi:hypothetical protein
MVGDNNDAMYMIGHHHKRIQLHIGDMIGEVLPGLNHDLASLI